MTAAAFVFVLFSVSSAVALVVWCYYRVLTTPPSPTAGSEHDTS